MNEEERVRRAKSLVDDPLFQESFEVLKKDLLNRWEVSGSPEVEARESIWLAMRLLDRLQVHLQSIVETGKMNDALAKQHPFI